MLPMSCEVDALWLRAPDRISAGTLSVAPDPGSASEMLIEGSPDMTALRVAVGVTLLVALIGVSRLAANRAAASVRRPGG